MYQILRTFFSAPNLCRKCTRFYALCFQRFGFGFLGTLIENKNQNYCVANKVLVKKKKRCKNNFILRIASAEALTGDSEQAQQYYFLFIVAALSFFQSPSHRAAQ